MLVIKQHRIYREDIQANPDVLYIFGDNLDRRGFGGQAKEMRGEINSFGIATKRSISHNFPNDYFFDSQPDVRSIIDKEFTHLRAMAKDCEYRAIVVPLDGIGTGLSRLQENAPKLLKYINEKLGELKDL